MSDFIVNENLYQINIITSSPARTSANSLENDALNQSTRDLSNFEISNSEINYKILEKEVVEALGFLGIAMVLMLT